MLYAVSTLNFPSGEKKQGYVVNVDCGIVKDFYPFVKEHSSMGYIQEACLFFVKDVNAKHGSQVVEQRDCTPMCLYELCDDGMYKFLE